MTIKFDLGEPAVLAGTLLATRNIAMTVSSLYFGYAVGRFGLVPTMIGANALAVGRVVGLSMVTDSRLLVAALVDVPIEVVDKTRPLRACLG